MGKKHIEDEHLRVETPEPPQEMDPSREPETKRDEETKDDQRVPWPAPSDCREERDRNGREKTSGESETEIEDETTI